MQRSYCREGKKMILHEVLSPGPSHSYRPLDPGHGPSKKGSHPQSRDRDMQKRTRSEEAAPLLTPCRTGVKTQVWPRFSETHGQAIRW